MPAASANPTAPGIHLLLIGIGTGHPEHLTLQAIAALNSADLVLIPRKGADKADLADLRRTICATHLSAAAQVVEFEMPVRDATSAPYLDGVNDWHDAIAANWAHLIAAHRPQGGRVALLVWGDPSLYDSSLRIAERLERTVRGDGDGDGERAQVPAHAHAHESLALTVKVTVEVTPGLSTLQLLTAAHAIPLNTLAAPVLITTGRHLRENGWLAGVDTIVVMLDGACAFQTLPPDGLHIYWAAYLGMPQQVVMSGPLADVGQRIVKARAAARAEHGWIMDAYLLRRGTAA